MLAPMRRARLLTSMVAICAVVLVAVGGTVLLGCTGSAPRRGDAAAAAGGPLPGPRYYLSLGDSLALGVQPTVTGASEPTSSGYPNRIYSVLRAHDPDWRLVKLGCSGETTHTMIHGGICRYPAGSQLAQAEQFLRAHRGRVGLVTIDIGANDPNSCIIGNVPLSKITSCMGNSIDATLSALRTIMGGLRSAAGPSVTILAMSYYVPELAGWFDGMAGKEIAVLTERLVAGYNRLLAGIYHHYGAQVANVFGAFHSSDFSDKVRLGQLGLLPRNVATICEWTWSCAQYPRGPNEHANDTGYGVIALAFLLADPRLTG
jgi:lysophospholipase L1-like esterase